MASVARRACIAAVAVACAALVFSPALSPATAALQAQLRVSPPRPHVVACHSSVVPTLDGVVDPSAPEWSDAASLLDGGSGGTPWASWTPQFAPVAAAADLTLDAALVKFTDDALWLGFTVTDDVQYGADTPLWTPAGNPSANLLNATGWPWFGDEMEVLLNARPGDVTPVTANASVVGNASQWQMVVNTVKSAKGGFGIGHGGLIEGEPRGDGGAAWSVYRKWIDDGAMQAATRHHERGTGYDVEWRIGFACVSTAPGVFYDPTAPSTATRTRLGFNVALGDVDTQAEGDPKYGLRHEMWIAGARNTRTQLGEFGALVLDKAC